MDIRSTFESELTEHTGKLRYHAGTREVSGRIGGVKRAFPETEKLKQSPKVIAAAIRKGKGKVFRQVHSVVETAMLTKGYSAPKRSSGVRSVDPHKGKRYCIHCRQAHTKGQHRFHGKGSFQQTHLFSFGKNPKMQGVKIYGKVLRIEAQKTGKHLCDSACKKANHRYYHDFRVKPSMYGLPDGSLLIKK